ncbi:GbsR/MarR family transcriptional regulator [Actinokineospora enzanensis]|uniref:GbsR/MarR family transcriptional regulator n=1 Tax=Actinokineospora enzanensis TaxID=155975 RepID=UPI000360563E|nr:MarR family transcriptional regulator [Actinokineospora enzanensis]
MAQRPDEADDRVAHYVERFALLMSEAGVPRMPARVFSALMATDTGKLTATELAVVLQVSPAAISGAVRYLDQVGMINKGRDPGNRRDHYAVSQDAWFEAITKRDKMLVLWAEAAAEGAETVGRDTPAGQRLLRSQRFFLFLLGEVDGLLQRWQAEEARYAAETQ